MLSFFKKLGKILIYSNSLNIEDTQRCIADFSLRRNIKNN